MYYSKLFGKTNKTAPHDADSANARLLVQGGFINQVMAGVYTYMPLGLRVLRKIHAIVREEMVAIDGQEILMPALQPKENWDITERWDVVDVNFKLKGAGDKEMALGSTHEEIVTPLVRDYIKSYKDLPIAVFQIQDKFRNEPRAKSGLMRGREFSMKDLYSFHIDEKDFEDYYEKSKGAYFKIFNRCGMDARIVEADGGAFSKFSHEFQVYTEAGEDTIYHCDKECGFAQNKEIFEGKEGDKCPDCDGKITTSRAVEVGNIFPLKNKFTGAFDFKVQGPDGKMLDVIMGCYGIGPSRVMGSIVEVHHDENGIVWPEEVAPFKVHIVPVSFEDEEQKKLAVELYDKLEGAGIEVLLDDRDKRPGEKFADADLIGCPYRVTVGRRASEGIVEFRPRATGDIEELEADKLIEKLK